MEKVIYLVQLDPDIRRDEVGSVMLGQVAPALLDLGPRGMGLDLWDEYSDIPAPVPLPAGESPVHAVVSLWLDAVDGRGPYESILAQVAHHLDGYSVIESLYRDYGQSQWAAPRDWPDGTRSPGVLTVALLEQHPQQTFEEWMTRWHTRISPITEAIQPRCRYVRNAVFRGLTPGAPRWRGIVEEAWPSLEAVTDPMQFFCAGGDPVTMEANLTTMIEEIAAFTEMDTFRSYTMSEWILLS